MLGKLQCFVSVFAFALSGCDGQEANILQPAKGQLNVLQIAKQVDQIPTISQSLFTNMRADCSSKDRLLESLWAENLSSLNVDAEPTLVDWGIAPIKLKDGDGQLVILRRQFKPGDPGVISILDDIYLVSADCRVMVWGFARDVL
jgi:hypothetical protein